MIWRQSFSKNNKMNNGRTELMTSPLATLTSRASAPEVRTRTRFRASWFSVAAVAAPPPASLLNPLRPSWSRRQISSACPVIPLITIATVAITMDSARTRTRVAPNQRGTRHCSRRSVIGTRMAASTAAIANGIPIAVSSPRTDKTTAATLTTPSTSHELIPMVRSHDGT